MKKIKLLLCLFMLTTLCGCSNSNKNASSKTLNAAMFWISTSLDPTNNYDGWVLSRIGVGETLLKLNEKYEVEPYLAKSYEQIDDTTWKLTLKDSITFSNGKKVTGENVKACLERAFEKNTRAIDYFDLNHVEAKGQDIYLYLNKSSGAILNNLCEPLFTIYDASQSEEDIANHPLCTGPFVVDDFASEKTIDTSKNKKYYDGKAKLDHVHFSQVADSDARVLALQSGEVDLANTIDYSSLKLFRNNKNYHVLEVLGPRTNVIYMNNETTFLSDLTIRKALSYSVNRKSIVKLIGGKEATGLYSSALPYGDVSNGYSLNLKEANRLLDEAGYVDTNNDGIREKDGQEIILNYYESADHGSADANIIAQSMQSEAKKIGIKIKLNQVENVNDIKAAGTFDLCSANDSSAPTGDPEIFIQQRYLSTGSSNTGRYKNSNLDNLIQQFSTTYDVKQRQQLAIQASEMILDDAANIYVSYVPLNTVTSSKVKGAICHPVDYYMITKDIDLK